MAGIEKICECPKGNCVYHGHKMYEYKHNHLQINPECREQFKGLSAFAVIVNLNNINSDYTHLSRKSKYFGSNTSCLSSQVFKEHGVYYYEGECRKTLLDKAINQWFCVPLRLSIVPMVYVYVKEHNKVYLNWLNSAKDIRAFKRNMRKLFGYNIPLYKNLKFKQKMQSYEIANKMIEDIKNENNYSNN